jgi:hypothetical protein
MGAERNRAMTALPPAIASIERARALARVAERLGPAA